MALKDLGKTATDVSDIIHKMATMPGAKVNEILGTINDTCGKSWGLIRGCRQSGVS